MSLTLIKHGNQLEILEGDLPMELAVKVFTEEEVKQMEGWAKWMALTDEQRHDMLMQTQSAEYREWMEEDDWEECSVMENPDNPYKVDSSQPGDSE